MASATLSVLVCEISERQASELLSSVFLQFRKTHLLDGLDSRRGPRGAIADRDRWTVAFGGEPDESSLQSGKPLLWRIDGQVAQFGCSLRVLDPQISQSRLLLRSGDELFSPRQLCPKFLIAVVLALRQFERPGFGGFPSLPLGFERLHEGRDLRVQSCVARLQRSDLIHLTGSALRCRTCRSSFVNLRGLASRGCGAFVVLHCVDVTSLLSKLSTAASEGFGKLFGCFSQWFGKLLHSGGDLTRQTSTPGALPLLLLGAS